MIMAESGAHWTENHRYGSHRSNDPNGGCSVACLDPECRHRVCKNPDDKKSGAGYAKRERRHVYHDILPLKGEPGISTQGQNTAITHVNGNGRRPSMERGTRYALVKPDIPPKPKYILRDKKVRHVYQSINLSTTTDSTPPPLPVKPPRLQKLKQPNVDSPPPLPPRILNREAMQQRQHLDHEYLENLRKSVDEELLDLAEENDLPVPLNLPVSRNMQSLTFQYGAHSPPLNLNNANVDTHVAPRRHSLASHELLSHDVNSSISAQRSELARSNSDDSDAEARRSDSAEINLANNFALLKRCGWYWGNMSWQEAEELLSKTEGSGKFQMYEPGGSVSQSTAQCVRHSNIKQFINLAVKHSLSGSFLYFLKPRSMGEPPVQIQLLTPISRLTKVKSLKYTCRMVIRQYVVPDLVRNLPVPPSIQQYLRSGPYYDNREEQYTEVVTIDQ